MVAQADAQKKKKKYTLYPFTLRLFNRFLVLSRLVGVVLRISFLAAGQENLPHCALGQQREKRREHVHCVCGKEEGTCGACV